MTETIPAQAEASERVGGISVISANEKRLLVERDVEILRVAGWACASCTELRLPLAREKALWPRKSLGQAALEVAIAVPCPHIEDNSDIEAALPLVKQREVTIELP